MRSSLILTVAVRAVFHTIVLFALFLLFAGHNDPGGGFVGGLVAAAAFALRAIEGGAREARDAARLPAQTLMGVGLLLAAGTGVAALATGDPFLDMGSSTVEVPLVGPVKLTSTLVFDVGVFLVVVGLALALLDALADEEVTP